MLQKCPLGHVNHTSFPLKKKKKKKKKKKTLLRIWVNSTEEAKTER
jgi:hypothetical protein